MQRMYFNLYLRFSVEFGLVTAPFLNISYFSFQIPVHPVLQLVPISCIVTSSLSHTLYFGVTHGAAICPLLGLFNMALT